MNLGLWGAISPKTILGAIKRSSTVSDTTAPTVTITSAQTSPSSTTPLNITFTWSEPVTGFAIGDITVGNGTKSNFAGSGATYTCDVTPTAAAVTVDVGAGVCTDLASNPNTAAIQFSITAFGLVDTFTDADNTTLANHTPDRNIAGGAWTAVLGEAQVISNQAQGTTGVGGSYMYVIESGQSDLLIYDEVTPENASGAGNHGVIARYQDSTHYWLIDIVPNFNLFRIIEDGATTRASTSVTIVQNTKYTLRVTLSGDTITATVNGANQISYTSSLYNNKTKHGISGRKNVADPPTRHDNVNFT